MINDVNHTTEEELCEAATEYFRAHKFMGNKVGNIGDGERLGRLVLWRSLESLFKKTGMSK